jgi:hypothetical protein
MQFCNYFGILLCGINSVEIPTVSVGMVMEFKKVMKVEAPLPDEGKFFEPCRGSIIVGRINSIKDSAGVICLFGIVTLFRRNDPEAKWGRSGASCSLPGDR